MNKSWVLLSHSYNPWYNLAVEEYLMNTIQPEEFVFFLWQNQHTVVIGKHQNAWRECKIQDLKNCEGKLARRLSGGGAVYHDLGNLNYTFACHKDRYDLHNQLQVILNATTKLGINASFTGRNDITVNNKKFSGNAFYQAKDNKLQHGTIMVDVNMSKLGQFLSVSKKKIVSKGVKSVSSRVINLKEIVPSLTIENTKDSLIDSFRSLFPETSTEIFDTDNLDIDSIKKLEEKYKSWDWCFGKTPSFQIQLEERFDWGEIQLCFTLKNGIIQEYKVFSDSLDNNFLEHFNQMFTLCPYTNESLLERISQTNNIDEQKKLDVINWIKKIDL
ncbi:MAG: lipoate--protein ligase [Caldisericia bacterium]|nr:lipoate--protein ligase [Caldisericia bacterium]